MIDHALLHSYRKSLGSTGEFQDNLQLGRLPERYGEFVKMRAASGIGGIGRRQPSG